MVRRIVVSLIALAVVLAAIPLLIAGLSYRNGHDTCDESLPAGMLSSDNVVQNKSRVTLFPLALECSYTTEQNPTESDYTVTTRDLGTAWWIGAPLSVAAAIFVAGSSRARRGR